MFVTAILSDAGLEARLARRTSRRPDGRGGCSRRRISGLLEAPDREAWQKPEQIMDALGVAEGSAVADIGAGAGWFTIQLARRVGPNGMVYAQDVQRQMLEAIRRRVAREGLQNVQTRLGAGSAPEPSRAAARRRARRRRLSGGRSEDRVTFLRNLAAALKPGGRIGIVNYKPGNGGPGPAPDEGVRVESASVEAGCAGRRPARARPRDPSLSIPAGSGPVVHNFPGPMTFSSGSTTLVAHRSRPIHQPLIRVGAVLFVTALTAAAAQISVPLPFTQVPFTFQPMVVLLGGLALGSRLGFASQVLYLTGWHRGPAGICRVATLPPGALRLVGPTGGYLMAYPIAAFVTGYLAERGFDRRYLTSVLAMLAGLLVIYACGATVARPVRARSADGAPSALPPRSSPACIRSSSPISSSCVAAAGILPGVWALLGQPRR